jgi:hypothetical protein
MAPKSVGSLMPTGNAAPSSAVLEGELGVRAAESLSKVKLGRIVRRSTRTGYLGQSC